MINKHLVFILENASDLVSYCMLYVIRDRQLSPNLKS